MGPPDGAGKLGPLGVPPATGLPARGHPQRGEGSLMVMPRSSRPSPEPAGRRGQVLRILKETAGPLSIAEIAARLGVHPNTVRFHLDILVENGQVERVTLAHRAPGRPPQLFQAVPGMDPTGPRHYQLLAEILADTLSADPDPRGRAVEAGRAWGWRYGTAPDRDHDPVGEEPVGRLLMLLDDLGFAPQRDDNDDRPQGGPQIKLRNCPFFELAASRPQIACAIHLGLMQGAMQAWDAEITVDRLDAFVEPDLCVTHLTRRGES